MSSNDSSTTVLRRLRERYGDQLWIGEGCDLPEDLMVEISEGAFLWMGERVSIRRGTTIQVHRGATVVIGHDVAIGEHCFLSAMSGIHLGDGSAISNMVDLHDHNHHERTAARVPDGRLVPWASGFAAAPIIIEPGAILSNKVSVTAGARIGHNSLVGANAVVTRSIRPNTIAAGVPATARRCFPGAALTVPVPRRVLSLGWFGTSIMEHLEGHNARMTTQADLPPIGSQVTVEGWHQRGYVHRLHLALRASWPHLDFEVDNRGEGGATSRDIAKIVQEAAAAHTYDLAFLGCGINDVWRGFQGRATEAVDLDEFTEHYIAMLEQLSARARTVVCLTETPFGPVSDAATVTAMNETLARYNDTATRLATRHGAQVLDVWAPFTAAARHLAPTGQQLWSDGIHLSELGDALMQNLVQTHLTENRAIDQLIDYPLLDRDDALIRYQPLFDHYRRQ
ncbi:MAG: GDSL-type esterase/lipase family protein [Actinomycetota bacterium]|nr:GDSL-type esterase/lipase family protein [Actinomycetota bacterium]